MDFSWQTCAEEFKPVSICHAHFRAEVVWEGEGDVDEYDPSDETDVPRLRFFVSTDADHEGLYSFCTLLTPRADRAKLEAFALRLCKLAAAGAPRRRFEMASWMRDDSNVDEAF